jgi:hypothetical protein
MAFDHDPLDHSRWRSCAKGCEFVPRGEGEHLRAVKPLGVEPVDETLKPLAAGIRNGKPRKIGFAVLEQVIGSEKCRVIAQLPGAHFLAIEALLEIGKTAGLDLGALRPCHKKLAIERAIEGKGVKEIGEGVGDVVAGARIEPVAPPRSDVGLHADAVPFPLRDKIRLGRAYRNRPHRWRGRASPGGMGPLAALTGFVCRCLRAR